jgi:hypothetical protein
VLQLAGSRTFTLRALVLWTIHDFPRYGNVGRFAHLGYVACPPCKPKLVGVHSIELGKYTYSKARRWLPKGHPYRIEAMKAHFDGQSVFRNKPMTVTIEKQLRRAVEMKAWLEDGNSEGNKGDPSKVMVTRSQVTG